MHTQYDVVTLIMTVNDGCVNELYLCCIEYFINNCRI